MIYVFILCYVKSRSYFMLLVFSTHVFLCLLSISGIYRLIQLNCCLHLLLIDSSQVEFVVLDNVFVRGCFFVTLSTLSSLCFVMDCQKGSLLGSKTLGLNILELHFVMLANHDQNVQSCFRLAQSMFMCKVGIECTAGFTV